MIWKIHMQFEKNEFIKLVFVVVNYSKMASWSPSWSNLLACACDGHDGRLGDFLAGNVCLFLGLRHLRIKHECDDHLGMTHWRVGDTRLGVDTRDEVESVHVLGLAENIILGPLPDAVGLGPFPALHRLGGLGCRLSLRLLHLPSPWLPPLAPTSQLPNRESW